MEGKTNRGKTKNGNNSNSKRNRIIFLLLLLIIVVIVVVVVVNNKNSNENTNQAGEQEQTQFYREEDGEKINTSKKLSETKEFEGLEISNPNLTEIEKNSSFIATLKNNTNSASGEFFLDLKFVDKNNNEIATISCYVDRVEPGQTVELNASATASLANAYDYTVSRQQ